MLKTDQFGRLIEDVCNEEEVEKFGQEGDIVCYEQLSVRVVVC